MFIYKKKFKNVFSTTYSVLELLWNSLKNNISLISTNANKSVEAEYLLILSANQSVDYGLILGTVMQGRAWFDLQGPPEQYL